MAPLAKSSASAKLVFPAPAGPTRATALTPLTVLAIIQLLIDTRGAGAMCAKAQEQHQTLVPSESQVLNLTCAMDGRLMRPACSPKRQRI